VTVRLNFVRLSPYKERTRSILWKQSGATAPRHPPPFHLLVHPNPVISSCTKLVKIPPVCPSLQPAQCGNHLTGKKIGAEERRNREKRSRYSRSILFLSLSLFPPFPSFSSLGGMLQHPGERSLPSVGRLLRGKTKNCSFMYVQ